MDALEKPLQALATDTRWFLRATELRVMHVRTTADTRKDVLRTLIKQESNHYNHSPMLVIEDAHTEVEDGWTHREKRLWMAHESQVERIAEAGLTAPTTPAATDEPPSGVAGFAAALQRIDAGWAEPMRGTIVVLAPPLVEDTPRWCAALSQLWKSPQLDGVRWIVVDTDGDASTEAVEPLGDAALGCRCEVDEEQLVRELELRLSLMRSAPIRAPGPARMGAAWPPGVQLPRRAREPEMDPAERDRLLEEAGVAPGLADEGGRELQFEVLGGALALRKGDGAAAVTHQRRARDLCGEMGLPKERRVMQMTLAGYLLQLEQQPAALQAYGDAARWSEEEDDLQTAALAHLAIGMIHACRGEQRAATKAYGTAGDFAERAEVTIIAIEAWRMAGQLALDSGQDQQGIAAWRRSLALAEADHAVAPHSSAPDTALALADVCDRHGLGPQADALRAQSIRLREAETDAAEASAP